MAGASSSKSKKNEEKDADRSRLKDLALEKRLISFTPAKGFTPLNPNKQVIKHHGRDITRKSSQRKNRFLFSFSGLLAPIGGGKIGELKNLGTKNPILYLDFSQGQMKLFGTIVYPENRYLTLQFSRGGKNVICEDSFDNMIVFSDSWWIGRKDENPNEAQLEFPKELSEGQHSKYDFKGGAGALSASTAGVFKTEIEDLEARYPASDYDNSSDVEKDVKVRMDVTPVRRSQRTAEKSFKFTEESSDDDLAESDADESEGEEKKVDKELDVSTCNPAVKESGILDSVIIDIDNEDGAKRSGFSKTIQSTMQLVPKSKRECQSAVAGIRSKEAAINNHNLLVQSTISTLFKKVEEKKASSSSRNPSASKASGQKLQNRGLKRSVQQAEVPRRKEKVIKESKGTAKAAKKKLYKTEDDDGNDDIEDFSNSSQDTNGSDEEWAA